MNNIVRKQIYNNIINGIQFKISPCGTITTTSNHREAKYPHDKQTISTLNCISNISYGLHQNRIGFKYTPMFYISNGWCFQNFSDDYIWNITNTENSDYNKTKVLSMSTELLGKSKIKTLSFIPPIELEDIQEEYEADFIVPFPYGYETDSLSDRTLTLP